MWLITPCDRSILNLPDTSCHAQRHGTYLECMYNRWLLMGCTGPCCQAGQEGQARQGAANMTTTLQHRRQNAPLILLLVEEVKVLVFILRARLNNNSLSAAQ